VTLSVGGRNLLWVTHPLVHYRRREASCHAVR
jgi:hypothetical protein